MTEFPPPHKAGSKSREYLQEYNTLNTIIVTCLICYIEYSLISKQFTNTAYYQNLFELIFGLCLWFFSHLCKSKDLSVLASRLFFSGLILYSPLIVPYIYPWVGFTSCYYWFHARIVWFYWLVIPSKFTEFQAFNSLISMHINSGNQICLHQLWYCYSALELGRSLTFVFLQSSVFNSL